MPILSDFYLSDRLFFSIGPEINYLVSAKNKYASHTQNITEYVNRFELSGLAAISFKINEVYSISLRYSHGMTQIWNDNVYTPWETIIPVESKDSNRYFQGLLKIRIKNWR